VRCLKHDYLNVITSDLHTWTLRHARWVGLEAREMMADDHAAHRVRPTLLGNPIERRRWMRERLYARTPLFVRAFLYWFYRYVGRLGFLDGKQGMVFHFLQGCWFRFLVDATIYEARLRERQSGLRKRSDASCETSKVAARVADDR
jgi:hypothetical protein